MLDSDQAGGCDNGKTQRFTPRRPASGWQTRGCSRNLEGIAISQDTSVPAPEARGAPGPAQGPDRATFGQVFAVGEFRALWSAQILSVAGDQLARVALTLLVFDRTRSPLLAAITFAASVVPYFVGGISLAGLADRFPRREVMILCDLLRAGLVVVMALPRMPVAALIVLLFAVTMISAPFNSARAALYPDILPDDKYVLGTAVTLTTMQFAQVVGFAVGGTLVSMVGAHVSLLIDAGTFVVSAVITRVLVHPRPSGRLGHPEEPASLSGLREGFHLVFTDARLRTPMLFGWLVAFYNAPEGIAAPLAAALGGGAVAVGMVLAATALGASVGAITFSRLVAPQRRPGMMGPLAVAACAVLVLFALHPPLPLALLILAVSGLFDCYQVEANASFVSATPASQRSQAFGIAQGGMSLGQGAAMVLAGVAAQHYPSTLVVAASGVIGAAFAGALALGRSSSH